MLDRDGNQVNAMNAKPIVFVGVATLDTIALVDRFPGPDERVPADHILRSGGGPAATAAVTCARLGVAASFVGALGDDIEGDEVVAELRAEGVGTEGVVRVPGARTSASIVLVDRMRGTRAIVNRPPPPLRVPNASPAMELIRQADWIHVDQVGWPTARAIIGELPTKLSIDGGNPIPGLSLASASLYAPTLQRLGERYGDLPPETLLRRARAEGAAQVVATSGAAGALSLDDDGVFAAVPAHRAEIVSTLGAGDVFHGALIAAVLRGWDLRRCTAYASVVAALSCAGLDGRAAIPRHEETLAALPTLLSRFVEESSQ